MGYFKKTQLAALSQGGVSLHAQVAHGRTNCGDVGAWGAVSNLPPRKMAAAKCLAGRKEEM